MSWEVNPEPVDEQERAALLVAAERAFAAEADSAWWRSGLEDLGGGAPAEQAGRDPDVVES